MEHGLIGIRINNKHVTILCSCGWESAVYTTETEARLDFPIHAGRG